MTLHISKGLEFPYAFIVGLEENLFPSGRSTESDNPTAIEEERRLMYVGMTRAEKKLYLTHARTRKVWGSEQFNPPSRFLKEIPQEFVQMTSSMARPGFVQRARDRFGEGPDAYASGGLGGYKQHPLMSKSSEGSSMPNYEDFGDEDFDDSGGAQAFKKGQRVRHPTYGVGNILDASGSGEDLKVSVVFGDNTVKKFVVKYARLERV